MIELSIKVSNSELSQTAKHTIYDTPLLMDHSDKTLEALVNEALSTFGGEPDDIVIKSTYFW